jgi:hypothetical protein
VAVSMAAPGQRRAERFTRQQWATIVIIGSVHFGSAICISLQAPFYPKEVSNIFILILLSIKKANFFGI